MGHQMLLITALVLIAGMAVGYWKGFLKMALSIAALVLSFVIVLALNPYVKTFLREKTPIYQNVKIAIAEALEGGEELENGEVLSEEQREKIDRLALPESWKKKLVEGYSGNVLAAVGAETFSEYISGGLADIVVEVLAFLLTFLIVFLLLQILMFAFDLIGKLPVLHGINKLAGAAVGLVLGFAILWLLHLLIASAAATGAKWAVDMMEEIQKSTILAFLYNGQLFSVLAKWLLS